MTRLFVPIALFVLSALATVMSLHAAIASAMLGICLCVYAVIRRRTARNLAPGRSGLLDSRCAQAGIALIVAPILVVALVTIGMSGFLVRR